MNGESGRLAVPVARDDHRHGPEDAAVTLVEYGDYECPFCRRAHHITRDVVGRLGSDVAYVFRHFPLTQVHPHAQLAAEAAEAAGAQRRFWQMHDQLYEHQPMLSPQLIHRLGELLGLDMERFENDLSNGRYRERVRRQFLGGVRSGVAGTPTFFINGERHDGSWDTPGLLGGILPRLEGAATHR